MRKEVEIGESFKKTTASALAHGIEKPSKTSVEQSAGMHPNPLFHCFPFKVVHHPFFFESSTALPYLRTRLT